MISLELPKTKKSKVGVIYKKKRKKKLQQRFLGNIKKSFKGENEEEEMEAE